MQFSLKGPVHARPEWRVAFSAVAACRKRVLLRLVGCLAATASIACALAAADRLSIPLRDPARTGGPAAARVVLSLMLASTCIGLAALHLGAWVLMRISGATRFAIQLSFMVTMIGICAAAAATLVTPECFRSYPELGSLMLSVMALASFAVALAQVDSRPRFTIPSILGMSWLLPALAPTTNSWGPPPFQIANLQQHLRLQAETTDTAAVVAASLASVAGLALIGALVSRWLAR